MNIVNTKNKLAVRLLVVFGVFLFLYTTTRAYLLSITWDESQSYLEFIRNNIVLWQTYDFMSANNHILNTLGGIIFTKLFGVSEFTLRISSLIAHIIFLVYSAKLVLSFENKWLALSAFVILNVNPFMLDFFSLARGYSISLAFMMVSVYYFYQLHIKEYRTKYAIASLLFSFLATLGNLTLLNYTVVLFGVIVLLLTYNNLKQAKSSFSGFKGSLKQLIVPTILLALFLGFILPYSFELKKAGALFMGGETGFWKDTIGTLVPRLWYHLDFSYALQQLTKAVFILIVLAASCYIGYKHAKKQTSPHNMFLGSLALLFFFIILFTLAQHYILGTLYLIERAVLFLYVLLLLLFVFFVNELTKEKKIVQSVLIVFAGIFFVHFACSFNTKYVYEWKEECETKEMLSDLKAIRKSPSGKFNLTIAMPLILESEINYYRVVDTLTWLNQAMRDKKLNYLNDYFFIQQDQYQLANKDSIELIKEYPITKNVLAKPKYSPKSIQTIFDTIADFESTTIDCQLKSNQEYSAAVSYKVVDSTANTNCLATVKYNFTVNEKLDGNMFMIFIIQNSKGEAYVWLRPSLMDFVYEIDKKTDAYFTCNFPATIKAGDEVKTFLWNPNKKKLYLNKLELKIVKYNY
jgi:hypothetical protein